MSSLLSLSRFESYLSADKKLNMLQFLARRLHGSEALLADLQVYALPSHS